MADENVRVFRTKTGTCTITTDEIVLQRDGVRGALAQVTIGGTIGRALTIYLVLAVVLLAEGIWLFRHDNLVFGGILVVGSAMLLRGVIASRHHSATPVITRKAIRRIACHAPRPPLTRGYFTVFFDESGRVKKRLIMLPGSLEQGVAEYAKATTMLQEAGLPLET